MFNEDTRENIMAFIRLFCPLVAASGAIFGYTIDAEALFIGIMILLALVTYIWSWWKNNNVTKAAKEAQQYLDIIKSREGVDRSDEEEAKG